jgi:uncharacterized Zn-binding protein involved in type VI secretion
MAAVAVGAGIAAAGAGGGLSGAYIGELIPTSPTGEILTGSTDVFICDMPAARAGFDTAGCSGALFSHSPPLNVPLIAEGSSIVCINNHMAARKGNKLTCGASISNGCETVLIGGETAAVPGLTIASEVPAELSIFLTVVMLGGTIIATGGAVLAFGWAPALGGVAGGLGGGYLLGGAGGFVGETIGEHYGNPELGRRIGEVGGGVVGSFVGGYLGARLGTNYSQRQAFNSSRSASQRAESQAATDPQISNTNKTVASDGDQTLSGWSGKSNQGQRQGYKEVPPREVETLSQKIGHDLAPSGATDQVNRGGFRGKFNASHAEKQLAILKPNKPIGVSKAMCPDCQGFFSKLAQYRGRSQVVGDPQVTRIFYPDGSVVKIPVSATGGMGSPRGNTPVPPTGMIVPHPVHHEETPASTGGMCGGG